MHARKPFKICFIRFVINGQRSAFDFDVSDKFLSYCKSQLFIFYCAETAGYNVQHLRFTSHLQGTFLAILILWVFASNSFFLSTNRSVVVWSIYLGASFIRCADELICDPFRRRCWWAWEVPKHDKLDETDVLRWKEIERKMKKRIIAATIDVA